MQAPDKGGDPNQKGDFDVDFVLFIGGRGGVSSTSFKALFVQGAGSGKGIRWFTHERLWKKLIQITFRTVGRHSGGRQKGRWFLEEDGKTFTGRLSFMTEFGGMDRVRK